MKMDIDGILKSIEAWSFATAIREGLYWFPMFESVHVIALAIVFGAITVLDLRLMGLASMSRPYQRVAQDILKFVWVAFALTVLTGALMFTTNATVYFYNTYFRWKMLLLLLAGLNMAAFELTAGRRAAEWDGPGKTHPRGRKVAALSLAIWMGVVVTGRMIGFTTSRAARSTPPPAELNLEDIF
jgi:hypothetical protein